ncbi:MAG: hypothetical protein RR494_10935 [Vagococcus sp.]|uniref:hypothetical protein n=1 Tax=Vagococcus TaxID=2737 RepID=UPI002FC730EB
MIPLTILIIVVLGFLFFKRRKNEKRMIDKLDEIKVIDKQIIDNSNKLKLVPTSMSSDLSNAGTKISENFFIANDSEKKKKVSYQLTIEATLENNRIVQEDIYVSKKLYSDVIVGNYYPLTLFK